jgi:hypothetical protein
MDAYVSENASIGIRGPLVILSHALAADNHMRDSTVLAPHKEGYRTLRYDHIRHMRTPPPQSLQSLQR